MTTTRTAQNHHTEALHWTRENQWKYHWFDIGQLPPPYQAKSVWKPSCDNDGCGYWNRCYDCNDFNATLLVDKAEFIARKQLEREYPEALHSNPTLVLRPHQFNYGTNIEGKNDPKRKKHHNWRTTKDRPITVIALDIAKDPMRNTNEEDLTTAEQVKVELTWRQYHYHKYLSLLTPEDKENKPHPQKKRKTTATSPRGGGELFSDNIDGSKFSVGYAILTANPWQTITLRLRSP
jgi:hypothetical protein